MDARLRYLSQLRPSVCTGTSTVHYSEAIRECLVEWILFRHYWDRNDNLESLSSKSGIPREDISCFMFDCTGRHYLTVRKDLRIWDARELLTSRPELSIYEISKMVGFTDKSNFRKDFTEKVGFRPALWRECKGSRLKCLISTALCSERNRCL